jgi:hypothetical protein
VAQATECRGCANVSVLHNINNFYIVELTQWVWHRPQWVWHRPQSVEAVLARLCY